MIRSLAFNAFFYLGTLIAAVIGIVLVPIPTPVLLRALLHHWARAIVWGMRWIGGMKVETRGLENLPMTGPVLLAASTTANATAFFWRLAFQVSPSSPCRSCSATH